MYFLVKYKIMNDRKITTEGFKSLEEKLHQLREERKETIERRNVAKEFGDLKENSEYSEANQRLNSIEAEIAEYDTRISHSEVFGRIETLDHIDFGAVVTIENVDTKTREQYCILGDYEADIDKKIISYNSPIAQSMHKCTKDSQFKLPSGKLFKVVDFYYPQNYHEFYEEEQMKTANFQDPQ